MYLMKPVVSWLSRHLPPNPIRKRQRQWDSGVEHSRSLSSERLLHRRAQTAQLPDHVRNYLGNHFWHSAGRPGQGIQSRPERSSQNRWRRPRHGLGRTYLRTGRRISRGTSSSPLHSGCIHHQVRSVLDQGPESRTPSQPRRSQLLQPSVSSRPPRLARLPMLPVAQSGGRPPHER